MNHSPQNNHTYLLAIFHRLLSQLVELDKRVNKKVTGEKSIYQ